MMLVAPLRACGRNDLALAGGKGANLGELAAAGFPVPDGFVVTTDAHTEAARSGAASALPEAVRAAIVKAYAELGAGPVAVRSSATAEDLPRAAFAGQYDTYLNVVGEAAVLDAVRRCWASLWTDRAVSYRRRLGAGSGDPDRPRIAVVVQRMVAAEFAGVMFTADPITGDRGRTVIDANPGLGEAVVSGRVTPDHYVVDRRGRVAVRSPGRREVVVRAAADGGLTQQADGTTYAEPPDATLRELARLGRDVARHFGRPQDIEWAYAGDRVWLVQARPMTALPPPPVRLNRAQRRLGSVLLEYLPVRPYPIDVTTWLPYGPAGRMGDVTAYFGITRTFESFLHEADGMVDRLVPPSPRPTVGVLRAPFRLVSLARRYDPARWTEDPRFAAYLEQVRETAAQDLSVMPWPRLIDAARQALDLVRPVIDLRIDYLPRGGLALLRLLMVLTLLRRSTLLRDLLLGAATRTGDANRALERLADRVRDDPHLAEAVARLDVARLPEFGDFHAAFQAFLAEYGHRETVTPILVTPPTWGEAPQTVLGAIKVLAGRPRADATPDGDAATPADTGAAGRAEAALFGHPLLRGRRRRARLTHWVEVARDGIAFREDSHFYFTMPLPILRRCLLELGARLCRAGLLGDPQEVFHLRLEELEAISDPAEMTARDRERLRGAVRARSAKRSELSGVRLIDPAAIFPRRPGGDALVSGAPAGGGTATGPVKVIRTPAEFAAMETGDVLVCPYTNPSWTPLFQRAAAVVVDSGSVASHAAITAREYGIPAVMGTADGTSTLTDGQVVTVDGDTGRVTSGGS